MTIVTILRTIARRLTPFASGAGAGVSVLGGNITVARSSTPPFVMTPFGAGNDAVGRAAQAVSLGADHAFPPLKFPTGGCSALGGGGTETGTRLGRKRGRD